MRRPLGGPGRGGTGSESRACLLALRVVNAKGTMSGWKGMLMMTKRGRRVTVTIDTVTERDGGGDRIGEGQGIVRGEGKEIQNVEAEEREIRSGGVGGRADGHLGHSAVCTAGKRPPRERWKVSALVSRSLQLTYVSV